MQTTIEDILGLCKPRNRELNDWAKNEIKKYAEMYAGKIQKYPNIKLDMAVRICRLYNWKTEPLLLAIKEFEKHVNKEK